MFIIRKQIVPNDPTKMLVKAHKTDHPLRPVISIIGSHTRILEKLLSKIIKETITLSKILIKNSTVFLKLIENVIKPTNDVLVSLAVIAMFPNIPKIPKKPFRKLNL